eukprot:4957342-Prymnesium_polylepis.3
MHLDAFIDAVRDERHLPVHCRAKSRAVDCSRCDSLEGHAKVKRPVELVLYECGPTLQPSHQTRIR